MTGRRGGWGGDKRQARARRQGTVSARFDPPVFAGLRPSACRRPPEPQAGKEELRAEAERAAREWARRYTPSDLADADREP